MVNKKYSLVPQTKFYDSMGANWKSFIMYTQHPNLRSKFCNTDKFGLRFNNSSNDFKQSDSIFDVNLDQNQENAVVVGGSFVFGEGATKDQFTISSQLSKKTKFNFFNLGSRGHSGYQEIMSFLSHIDKLKNIKKIIIISGLNDLVLSNFIKTNDEQVSPIFGHDLFRSRMSEPTGWKAKIIKKTFGLFIENVDWSRINYLNYKDEFLKIINIKKKSNLKKNYNNYLNVTIEKNLKIWSIISRGLNIPIYFILQPNSIWQEKILSKTEKEIFSFAEKEKNFKKLYEHINEDKYKILKKKIESLSNQLKINFCDLNLILKDKKIKDTIWVDKIHKNDLGYEIVSNEIIKKLNLSH